VLAIVTPACPGCGDDASGVGGIGVAYPADLPDLAVQVAVCPTCYGSTSKGILDRLDRLALRVATDYVEGEPCP
jgi:hypothetical protein